MREVDLTPYGFPDAVVREDGTLLRKGRRVHPDFHGFVKPMDAERKQRAISLAKLVATAFVLNPNNYPYV